MKKLIKITLACAMIASGVHRVVASPVMRLSADGGINWTNVVDNGPLDQNPAPGLITYAGPVGNWVASIATGLGAPLAGTPTAPVMDVNTLDFSSDAETLIVQMSDTGFTPFPNETFVASLTTTTDGTITYNTYRDTGNVLFGSTGSYPGDPVGVSPSPTASLLMTEGPIHRWHFHIEQCRGARQRRDFSVFVDARNGHFP
jgi:hypothetical protein